MSTESLIEMAEAIFINNYFEFDDRFRKQKQGTAIETKFAPSYLIVFLAALEK